MAIGKNLKKILEYENMSVKELSKKSGVANTTIYRIIERDNLTIKPDINSKLTMALSLSDSLSLIDDLSITVTDLILSSFIRHAINISDIYLDEQPVYIDKLPIYTDDYSEIMLNYLQDHAPELYSVISSEIVRNNGDIWLLAQYLEVVIHEYPSYEVDMHKMLVDLLKANTGLLKSACNGLQTVLTIPEILLLNSNEMAIDDFLVTLIFQNCKIVKFGDKIEYNEVDLKKASIMKSNVSNVVKFKKFQKQINNDVIVTITDSSTGEKTQMDNSAFTKKLSQMSEIEKRHMYETANVTYTYSIPMQFNSLMSDMVKYYSVLNENGRKKAIEQLEMLSKIPEYQAANTSNSDKTDVSDNTDDSNK